MSQNITLLGASYPDVPSVLLPKTGGGTASFVDVTDTTATASDVASGKLFHAADGTLATGAASTRLTIGAIRPDAELVKTVSYDKWMIDDEVVESLPAYTTTAQTLVASDSVGTYTADVANYNYYYCIQMLAIPTYSTTSKAKGRVEWWAGVACYDMADIPENSFKTYDRVKTYTSVKRAHGQSQLSYNLLYWSSTSAISLYSSGLYGIYMTVTAPSISSNTITLKSPAFNMRGSTTYFTSTFMNAVTDIRYQYVIRVYRSRKGDMNVDGWGMTQLWSQVIDGMNNNNWTLS